jgi:hypothetical protein
VILEKGSTDFSIYSSVGSIFSIPLFNETKRRIDYLEDYICFDIVALAGNVSIVDCQTTQKPI